VEYVGRLEAGASAESVCTWIDHGNGAVGPRFWTLDPIDGTKGFLRGDQYAVALALIVDGDLKAGALACPYLPIDPERPDGARGILFSAGRGEGAWAETLEGGERTRIRVVQGASAATFRMVESVESGHGDHSLQGEIARAVGIRAESVRMDSQAKYGAVARGEAALYLRLPSPKTPDYRENIWDHAAGALIVEEAGGRVTDIRGRALDFASGPRMEMNRGVVVSNGAIHDGVLRELARWWG
jgi:3'(2'), 5'-bisphosphate nucleotidase